MKATAFLSVCLFLALAGCSDKPAAKPTEESITGSGNLPSEGEAATVTQPSETFNSKCAACHGVDGAAGIANAANLKTSGLDEKALIKVISEGRNAMPSFKSQLTQAEIKELAAYVEALRNNK